MPTLLAELQAREVELHHPGVRSSRERLGQLLHPEFHEVGRSGRKYSRDTVLAFLVAETTHAIVHSDQFNVELLAPGLALLTYRSAHRQADGVLTNHTFRASIWQQTSLGWQLSKRGLKAALTHPG
jgi:hypothetical protein